VNPRQTGILRGGRVFAGVLFVFGLVPSLIADEKLPNGTLTGRVITTEDQPVVGARVSVNTYGDKLLAESQTDGDGRFQLGPMPPVYRHRFDLSIEADGFANGYVPGNTWSIFPGAENNLGSIQLDRGSTFSGQVLDIDGTPRAGAMVECKVDRFYLGNTIASIGRAPVVTTDTNGRFHTPPLPVGRLYMHVRVPVRQLAWLSRAVQPEGHEALPPFHLESDVPIQGSVCDEQGSPITEAQISANSDGDKTTSDHQGNFTLHGFGPNPHFQLQIQKDGYVFVNRGVTVGNDGIRWQEVGGDNPAKHFEPTQVLNVVMQPKAWIEGHAVDSETGKPVRLTNVILCFFERKADGEIVRGGCKITKFEQPTDGQYRVPYSAPDEYHLTFSAAGYQDAEVFTPKVTELKTIDGIDVKLIRTAAVTKSDVPKQTISGIVTRNGEPVKTGWVGLWEMRSQPESVNAYIMRGRTTEGDPIVYGSAPIRNGVYSLDVPFQRKTWYVVAEEPDESPTQIGPIQVDLNDHQKLDIACVLGGAIRGTVLAVPDLWKGNLWVIAFTKTGIRMESRVGKDSAFCLELVSKPA